MPTVSVLTTVEAARGKSSGRQAVWEAICDMQSYTLFELQQRLNHISAYIISDFNVCLLNGGYVTKEVIERKRLGQTARYTLARNVGHVAPRLNKRGELLPETGQQRMWRTMKMLKTFTELELAAAASIPGHEVTRNAAHGYLMPLVAAGYVVVTVAGDRRTPARYRFVAAKNTGGRAPMITVTKVLFDPNIGKAFCLAPLED